MTRYNLTRSLEGALLPSGDLALQLPAGTLTVPKDLISDLATPYAGPFVVGQHVVSPRASDLPLTVMQVGPIDFSGITAYLCRVSNTENDLRWFAETDLMASP